MAKSWNVQAQEMEQRLLDDPKIYPANKEAARKRIASMTAKGMNPRTIIRDIYTLKLFLETLGNKHYKKATKEDLEEIFTKIERGGYSDSTKEKIRVAAKTFYRYLLGEDMYYPKQVAWIRVKKKSKPKLPEILTEQEVKRMIEATPNPRDKAIIALLFDSGIRIGELTNLKVKDVDLTGEPGHIIVDGKTGMRKIPIFFSAPYIARYIDTSNKRDPKDPLFLTIGTWINTGYPIDAHGISKMLKLVGEKAGIKKRIYPHLFRHSRASFYANKMTEQQLKVFFGWVGDSKMAATYVHLSGRDIDNAALQANGKAVNTEETKPKLTSVECQRCHEVNAITALHCSRCGAAMEMATVIKERELEDKATELATRSFESLKEKKDVVKRIKERKNTQIKD